MLRKAHIKIMACAICNYLFFLMHTSVLLQNKKFLHRCSQIACTVTTMNIMWTQVTLHKHENLFTVLITLLKLFEFANLSFFFFFCPVLVWFYFLFWFIMILLPVRVINCENFQLFTGVINLSQLRTTFHLPAQTIMI